MSQHWLKTPWSLSFMCNSCSSDWLQWWYIHGHLSESDFRPLNCCQRQWPRAVAISSVHRRPNSNISTTTGCFVMTFGTDVHGAQMMKTKYFGDSLIFPLVTQVGRSFHNKFSNNMGLKLWILQSFPSAPPWVWQWWFWVKCLNNYWMDVMQLSTSSYHSDIE